MDALSDISGLNPKTSLQGLRNRRIRRIRRRRKQLESTAFNAYTTPIFSTTNVYTSYWRCNKLKSEVITLRCSEEVSELVSKIAAAEGKTKSEVLRMLVEKGMAAGGYLPGIKELDTVVQEAVSTVLQPAVERLASISAKAAHISAAAFFLSLYTDRLLLTTEQREELDDIAARARRLGIEYLKVSKDRDLDEWLAQACRRMQSK